MIITAKSVIFDVANNCSGGSLGVRSIEFKLGGTLLALVAADFTAYSTTQYSASYAATYAFDTSTSKIGVHTLNSWLSSTGYSTNQRLSIVFNSEQQFDEIVINNFHNSGGITNVGAKTTRIMASQDSITSTVFYGIITNAQFLAWVDVTEHVSSDVINDETIYNGEQYYLCRYSPAYSTDYVKSTSQYNTTYVPWYGADPSKAVTGGGSSLAWLSANGSNTNQKFNVDLGTSRIINRIQLENAHTTGGNVDRGINNFSVYGTDSAAAFANVTYSNTTDLTLLGTFAAAQHTAVDEPNAQYFALPGTTAYRYYVLRIADGHGGSFMGFRHVGFQTIVENESWNEDKKITLTLDKSSSDLTNFPVLINLSDSSGKNGFDCSAVFDELGGSSKKISVEMEDTGRQCYVEIEKWDSVNKSAQLWVKVFTVSSTINTVLNFYYDSEQIDNMTYIGDTGNGLITPEEIYSSSTSAGNRTRRQFITTSVIIGSGNRIRVKFLYSGSGSYTLNDVWIALKDGSEIDAYDYEDGTQIQLTKNSSTSITIDAVDLSSDWVDMTINGNQDIFIGYTSTEALPRGSNIPTGHTIWYKSSVVSENGTADVAGYSSQSAAWNVIALIEATSPSQNVWDDNFVAVYHMGQDPSGTAPQILDSTGSGLDLTSEGIMTSADLVDGNIGKAIDFDDGDDALVSTENHGMTSGNAKTIEMSVKNISGSSYDVLFNIGIASAGRFLLIDLGSTSNGVRLSTNAYQSDYANTNITNTDLHNLVAVFPDSSQANVKLYNNGVEQTRTTLIDGVINTADSIINIGKRNTNTYYIGGIIDETRLSNTERNEAWIETTYNSNTDTLITFSIFEGTEDRYISAFANFPNNYNKNFLPDFAPSGLIRQKRKGFSKPF